MEKLIISLIMLICYSISANSQIFMFKLTPEGRFVTGEDKDYFIYTQEGKTAHELYQMVCTNAAKVYSSPKDVLSTVEDKSVSIRAISNNLVATLKSFGKPDNFYECHYNLRFEFKDGKIKVYSPILVDMYFENHHRKFSDKAKKMFDENGNVKKRMQWDIDNIYYRFECIYSGLLNLNENDW